jgi:hypothetical protein
MVGEHGVSAKGDLHELFPTAEATQAHHGLAAARHEKYFSKAARFSASGMNEAAVA